MKKKQTISLLWCFLKGAKRYFLITILAAGVTALADMLQPQIIRAAVDCALGGEEGDFPAFVMELVDRVGGFAYLGQHLWIMALAVLAVALVQVVSQYAFRVYNTKASETLVKTMRDRLFSHIQSLPFSWHMQNRTGDIIQRCTSDVDVIRSFVCNQMVEVVRTVFLICLYLSIMFSMNVKLSLVALLFTLFAGLAELPTDATPYSEGIKIAVIVMFCVIPMIAWVATLWAMKGYELDGKRVKEIQAITLFGSSYGITKNPNGTYTVDAGTGSNPTTNESWNTAEDIRISVTEQTDGTQKLEIKIDQEIDLDLDLLAYIDPGITVNIIHDGQVTERRKLALSPAGGRRHQVQEPPLRHQRGAQCPPHLPPHEC